MRREFPRHLDSLAGLYEFSEAIMAKHDLPDGVRFPVHLAMEELFVNMVHYNPEVTTNIEVSVTVTVPGTVPGTVTVTDTSMLVVTSGL